MFFIALHHCIHDQLFPSFSPEILNISTVRTLTVKQPRRQFQIKFDYSKIKHDDHRCAHAGDVIQWSGRSETCVEADIPDAQTLNSIEQTFRNLEKFMKKLIKVDPVEREWQPVQVEKYINYQKQTDTDFLFTILLRPYGSLSSTIASAGPLKFISGRPIQGVVFVNVAQFGKVASDEHTVIGRASFEVAFHELCHALGISFNIMPYWINPETGTAYGKNLPLTYIKNPAKYGTKQFAILHTPLLHKWAVERWGIENFAPDCPAGLELEDFGGPGTALSHPKERIAYGDIMVGVATGIGYISDLVFTMLEDTGWYTLDYSLAERLAFGHYEALGLKQPMTSFPVGPPLTSWPDFYIPKANGACSFDYRYQGTPQRVQWANVDKSWKDKKPFVNPNDEATVGRYGFFDLAPIVFPYSNGDCRNPATKSFAPSYNGEGSYCVANSGGSNTQCQKMWANNSGVFIEIDQTQYKCSASGEQIAHEMYKLFCPDLENFAAFYKFEHSKAHKPGELPINTSGSTQGTVPAKKKQNNKMKTYGIVTAVLVVVVLGGALGGYAYWKNIYREKDGAQTKA